MNLHLNQSRQHVYDGLLHSDEAIITVAISDNLCSYAVANVVSGSDANSYTNEYPSFLIYDEEYFIDEGNGAWDPTEVFYDVGDFIYTNGEEIFDLGLCTEIKIPKDLRNKLLNLSNKCRGSWI